MDPMTKMWVSLVGIGLMILSAVLIMFTRAKTKGIIRFVLSLVSFAVLLLGMIFGLFSII
ncbi:MAG: DUF2768 domain-containing protein [Cohnella sp.]|uniref:DUF2768 family protein n=1 Tax=Cohnella sp. TaxID=1883426 RepID=UPI000E37A862|nr:DUF2768 family protein [Cohnella sp.]REK66117.1 MAG: DUF2768 domain-containing protein [Cohnella sp.]